MPHGGDVEAAADVQPLGDVRQMHRAHKHIRQAFVAFRLEVVLGEPEGVVAVGVHRLGDGVGLGIDAR